MERRKLRPPLEAGLLFLAGIGLLIASWPEVHLSIANRIAPSLAWVKRAGPTSVTLFFAGIGTLLLAWASLTAARRGSPLASRAAAFAREILSGARAELGRSLEALAPSLPKAAAFLAVFAVGAWLRAAFLAQPMRYDESCTVVSFASGPLVEVFNYEIPNNHVLHSILVRISVALFGTGPAAARLPALLAGLAVLPATFLLARALTSWLGAFFAAAGAAVMPYLVLYSTNARGYSLIALLALLLALAGLRFARSPSRAALAALAAIGGLGMLTMPTMLYVLAGVLFWISGLLIASGWPARRVVSRFAAPFALATGAVTLFLYVPVFFVANGIVPVVASPHIARQSLRQFVGLLRRRTLADFGRDIPAAAGIAALLLAAWAVASAVSRKDRAVAWLLPSMAAGAVAVIALHPAIPYTRTWIYVIPLALAVAGAGFAGLAERLSPALWAVIAALLVALSAVFAAGLVSRDAVAHYDDTGTFREAEAVARYLAPRLARNDRIEARMPADWPLWYYLWRLGIPPDQTRGRPGGRTFFVVKTSAYAIRDLVREPVLRLFSSGDAAVYGLPRRFDGRTEPQTK